MSLPITGQPSPTGDVPVVRAPAASRAGTAMRWLGHLAGWPALAVVMVGLALRWQNPERSLVIAIVGLTPFLFGPLLVGLIGALLSRSNTLRALAAVVTGAFVFTVSPVDAVVGCRAETAPDAITLYSANVLAGGGRPADIASSVLAADADVVVMQEVRWQFLQDLRADPRLSEYQWWSSDQPDAPTGELIWSKQPMRDVETQPLGNGSLVSATIDAPTGAFRVSSVHTQAPAFADENVWVWHNQLRQLAAIEPQQPQLLAGDFNATSDHQPFRRLLDAGWTDVHDVKGCGFDTTWPADGSLPLPVYRLDHVLTTDEFEVLDVRFGDPGGSDHLPVVTSLRLRDQAVPS